MINCLSSISEMEFSYIKIHHFKTKLELERNNDKGLKPSGPHSSDLETVRHNIGE